MGCHYVNADHIHSIEPTEPAPAPPPSPPGTGATHTQGTRPPEGRVPCASSPPSGASAHEHSRLARQIQEVLRRHAQDERDRHADPDRGHGQR